MKLAAVSDDGTTISRHFGRAAYYVVVTVENGIITARETRDKLGHIQFTQDRNPPGDIGKYLRFDESEHGLSQHAKGELGQGRHGQGEHGQGEHGQGEHGQGEHGQGEHGHGCGTESHSKHKQMASTIEDCEVLLARGMGAGAYLSLASFSIQPRITDIASIDEAVQEYLAGTLIDHVERLH